MTPEPRILDSGTQVLIANIPEPWKFTCTEEELYPTKKIGGSYLLLDKTYLCMCSILVGRFRIHGSITACKNMTGHMIRMSYTVNQAVLLYYPRMLPKIDRTRDINLGKPIQNHFRLPRIEQASRKDVLLQKSSLSSAPLQRLVTALEHNYTLIRTQADKALLEEKESQGILSMTSLWLILITISLIIILAIVYKVAIMRLALKMKTKTMACLVTAANKYRGIELLRKFRKNDVQQEIEMSEIGNSGEFVNPSMVHDTLPREGHPPTAPPRVVEPITHYAAPPIPTLRGRMDRNLTEDRTGSARIYPKLPGEDSEKVYLCRKCHRLNSQRPCENCIISS
jgi:hypothetical protein